MWPGAEQLKAFSGAMLENMPVREAMLDAAPPKCHGPRSSISVHFNVDERSEAAIAAAEEITFGVNGSLDSGVESVGSVESQKR